MEEMEEQGIEKAKEFIDYIENFEKEEKVVFEMKIIINTKGELRTDVGYSNTLLDPKVVQELTEIYANGLCTQIDKNMEKMFEEEMDGEE